MASALQFANLLNRFSGVPADRPIPDLPSERPDFDLLFGNSSGRSTPASRAEKGQLSARGEDVEVTDKLTMTWVRHP